MAGKALVIIDVQNRILDIPGQVRGAETKAALDVVVNRLAAVIAEARAAGIPVVFVQHDGDPGHRLEKGSDGWRIRPEIAPLPTDVVVHKTACDSFFDTDLQDQLQRLGVQSLIVGGCMTQFCVDTTVRRAVSLGYDVTLIADGHMTADFGSLGFEQIIQHHNSILNGFDAGAHCVTVKPAADLALH